MKKEKNDDGGGRSGGGLGRGDPKGNGNEDLIGGEFHMGGVVWYWFGKAC